MPELPTVETLRSLSPALQVAVPVWHPQPDGKGLRQPSEHIDVKVVVWPLLDDLGVVRRLHGYSITETFIVLREMNRQVLLHELLHVILDGRLPSTETEHGHAIIGAIEVGLGPFLDLLTEEVAS